MPGWNSSIGFDPSTLVTLEQIRGDLHMHTVASDGRATIAEMARAARERGYEYIAITDHSRSSVIANGLDLDRMRAHIDAIREINAETADVEILVGCECDILPDGSMDYPDDILAACDWVVASIHQAMARSVTERTISAVRHPLVRVLRPGGGRSLPRD